MTTVAMLVELRGQQREESLAPSYPSLAVYILRLANLIFSNLIKTRQINSRNLKHWIGYAYDLMQP